MIGNKFMSSLSFIPAARVPVRQPAAERVSARPEWADTVVDPLAHIDVERYGNDAYNFPPTIPAGL